MWHEYFDQATIIGVDIQQDCRCYARDRIMVEIGSQEDPGFLADLVRRYPPRIIVDDGSHLAHHVIFTFETLFPALEPGGIYVIEDSLSTLVRCANIRAATRKYARSTTSRAYPA